MVSQVNMVSLMRARNFQCHRLNRKILPVVFVAIFSWVLRFRWIANFSEKHARRKIPSVLAWFHPKAHARLFSNMRDLMPDEIRMAHGSGGRLMHRLINDIFTAEFAKGM